MPTTKEYLQTHMGHRRAELQVSLNSVQSVTKDIFVAFAGDMPDWDAQFVLQRLTDSLKAALETALVYREASFSFGVAEQLEEKHD